MVAVMMKLETRRNGVPAEVHALLVLWGNYTRYEKIGPQGYPSASPFEKMALYGKLGIPQESNVRIEQSMPALVEWIDKIITAMPDSATELKEVLETKYRPHLTPSGNEPNDDQKARHLSMSLSTFRNRLEAAQWYVFARMY